jgi:hypothetical protein
MILGLRLIFWTLPIVLLKKKKPVIENMLKLDVLHTPNFVAKLVSQIMKQ